MNETPLVKNPELGSDTNIIGGNRRGQTPFDAPRPSRVKKFFKWAGLTCLLGAIAAFGYFNFTKHGRDTANIISDVVPGVINAKMNPGLIFDNTGSDVINILLIGRDVNWKIGKVFDPTTGKYRSMQVVDENTPARSDTMIIMSLDRTRHEVHMISLPRDAYVHMPPNKYDVRKAKLNAAHAYGGPDLLMQTISEDLGLKIHHYAVIRFEGFKKLIDEVGGVNVDVIGALKRGGVRGNLDYDDKWGNLHIHLKPGKQILDGTQAHNYVRFRMDLEGDPGRIKRQQQVMRALAHQMAHQPWYKVAPLVQEIRRQFKTDMNNETLASAAQFVQGIGDASKVQPLTMFGVYSSRGHLILNKPKNVKLFKYLFGPTFDETKFLENSPSTEGDEMGEENNSSPGAKAVLRRAGILKGGPTEAEAPTISSREVTNEKSIAESTPSDASSRDSRLAVSENPIPELNSSSSDASAERPRRHRMRRSERSDAASTRASRETSSAPRPHVDLSVPDDETRRDDTSEKAPARERGNDSPVPIAEPSTSSHASGESPVPRAE